MGLFSFFGKKSPEDLARKFEKVVADKRAYAPDRWEAIRALAAEPHPSTAKVLLTRFTFRVDPSITDQEEKDLAFKGIVAAGEDAVETIREFLATSESATWPVKMLSALLPEEKLVEIVLEALEGENPAYAKDPQRKIQFLLELEVRNDPRIVDAAARFLVDPNEQVRLHALSTIAAQESIDSVVPTLRQLFETEETARARAAVLDAFVRHQLGFTAETAHLARAKAPSGFSIQADGTVVRG